ncbi:MAG: hypothetical protein LBF32_01280 [Streptococcaceae bacterium]|jgi:hypothetical protein|nr:hypothetical protein [Streptococcaceae bacterium]
MKEEKYYQTIKQVSEEKIKKKRAAILLSGSHQGTQSLVKQLPNLWQSFPSFTEKILENQKIRSMKKRKRKLFNLLNY